MMNANTWQTYFDGHAHEYMAQWYTQGWKQEVDFLESELGLTPGSHILDVGCGAGRHSVELARRGYRVTGLDFSAGMLAEARNNARTAGVEVTWVHADATQFTSKQRYDGAICMLEAAIGLIPIEGDPHAHDLAVMRNVCNVLKVGAKFILEVPNAIRMLHTLTPEAIANREFDPVRMIYTGESTWTAPDGTEQGVVTSTRNYVPTELSLMLRQSGFMIDAISGKPTSRTPLTLDDYTIVAIASKV